MRTRILAYLAIPLMAIVIGLIVSMRLEKAFREHEISTVHELTLQSLAAVDTLLDNQEHLRATQLVIIARQDSLFSNQWKIMKYMAASER